jgi:hypothetical protein
MKFDYYTYHISEHYLPALINGDYSGLTDQEEAELNTWIDSLPVSGHFDYLYRSEDIRECEISGLLNNTIDVRLYFQPQEATE